MSEQTTRVQAALACEYEGKRYEWAVITAETWQEWEGKARKILREHGIPDHIRAERWTHVMGY